MGVFLSLEDAKLWKSWQDIEAMKRMAGGSVFRFVLLKDNRDEIYEKVENYTRAEFGIENEEHYRCPKK